VKNFLGTIEKKWGQSLENLVAFAVIAVYIVDEEQPVVIPLCSDALSENCLRAPLRNDLYDDDDFLLPAIQM